MVRKTLKSFREKFPAQNIRPVSLPDTDVSKVRAKWGMERLQDGSIVGIVGGGPGGMACAITLKRLARERGIRVQTVIYEGKTYSGVPHYNQCVGVLSPPIRSLLEDQLQVPFPDHLVQREITGYILYSDNRHIELQDESEPSFAVRRITFDSYLLDQALQWGVDVRQSRVTDLELHPDRVILYSETDYLRCDVVVGAFGLDDGSIQMFERATDYRSPEFLYSIVTKIHPGMDYMAQIGNKIFAFLPSYRRIEFGAITPKYNHITINIAGKDINTHWMDTFLRYSPVRQILPSNDSYDHNSLFYFKGKFPISIAKNYYGHRYVMIGDAAGLVRPFKGKGINSAFQSGIHAAQVMMHEGISRQAFKLFEETCHEIIHDLPYGHFMRRFAILSTNYGLLDFFIHFAHQNQIMQNALFNSVSAHKFYREILRETVRWPVLKDAFRSFYKYYGAKFHQAETK
ncbi:NAD(P)/FAD-dependent oxidoreductase [candidate division KSB1 bacterium]|nr:NAD(P)/FAD-dependent oxidoreductase [candidate division KSB1 bacterium]